MLAILEANLATFDVFALVATVVFLVAAFLARPDRATNPPAAAWATTLAYIGLAVFACAFLFMTP